MKKTVSIAIETSCRAGGVALGIGDDLAGCVAFETSARHATQLIRRLDELLRVSGLRADKVDEVYVSAGPGGFTGLRVGITVARTLAQQVPGARCVAVPTAMAVARNARDLSWRHLGVIMDARDEMVYARLFARRDGRIVPADDGGVYALNELLDAAPRPLTLVGEGLAYHTVAAGDVVVIDPADTAIHLPNAEGVWCVGRELSRAGQFTDYHRLGPLYARRPEAVRLWERRNGKGGP